MAEALQEATAQAAAEAVAQLSAAAEAGAPLPPSLGRALRLLALLQQVTTPLGAGRAHTLSAICAAAAGPPRLPSPPLPRFSKPLYPLPPHSTVGGRRLGWRAAAARRAAARAAAAARRAAPRRRCHAIAHRARAAAGHPRDLRHTSNAYRTARVAACVAARVAVCRAVRCVAFLGARPGYPARGRRTGGDRGRGQRRRRYGGWCCRACGAGKRAVREYSCIQLSDSRSRSRRRCDRCDARCGVLDVMCLAGVYFPSVKLYRKKQIQTSEEWHADAGACSQFGGQFGGLVRALRLTDDRSGKEVRETPSER